VISFPQTTVWSARKNSLSNSKEFIIVDYRQYFMVA